MMIPPVCARMRRRVPPVFRMPGFHRTPGHLSPVRRHPVLLVSSCPRSQRLHDELRSIPPWPGPRSVSVGIFGAASANFSSVRGNKLLLWTHLISLKQKHQP